MERGRCKKHINKKTVIKLTNTIQGELLGYFQDQPHWPRNVLHFQRSGCRENLPGVEIFRSSSKIAETECAGLLWTSNQTSGWFRHRVRAKSWNRSVLLSNARNYKAKYIPGKNRGLTLIIDSHSNILSPSTVRDDFEGFMSIVNSRSKFPSLFEKVKQIVKNESLKQNCGAWQLCWEIKITFIYFTILISGICYPSWAWEPGSHGGGEYHCRRWDYIRAC